MPKKITISPHFHQVVVDGELFPYVLADEPTVEEVGAGAYRVTFVTYAQEVDYNPVLNVVDEYGETISADSDPFFDQDCPNFVFEDDETPLEGVNFENVE